MNTIAEKLMSKTNWSLTTNIFIIDILQENQILDFKKEFENKNLFEPTKIYFEQIYQTLLDNNISCSLKTIYYNRKPIEVILDCGGKLWNAFELQGRTLQKAYQKHGKSLLLKEYENTNEPLGIVPIEKVLKENLFERKKFKKLMLRPFKSEQQMFLKMIFLTGSKYFVMLHGKNSITSQLKEKLIKTTSLWQEDEKPSLEIRTIPELKVPDDTIQKTLKNNASNFLIKELFESNPTTHLIIKNNSASKEEEFYQLPIDLSTVQKEKNLFEFIHLQTVSNTSMVHKNFAPYRFFVAEHDKICSLYFINEENFLLKHQSLIHDKNGNGTLGSSPMMREILNVDNEHYILNNIQRNKQKNQRKMRF